jgi:anti-anti-sigma factor
MLGLQISIREYDHIAVVDLQGRATNNGESELLKQRIRDLVAHGKHKLLLNLVNLSQIDSSGVSVVVENYVCFESRGCFELKLLSPRGRVRDVLTVCRLLDAIPSFEDETQALASFRS